MRTQSLTGKPSRCLGRSSFLLTLFSLFWASSVFAGNTLKDIKFSTLPGDKVQITLSMSGPATAPKSFATDKPARISLDFKDTNSALAKKTHNIGIGKARNITAIEAGGRTRVVISLVSSTQFKTKLQGNDVIITLDSGSGGSSTIASRSSNQGSSGLAMTDIDFRRGENGEGRVVISLTDPSAVIDIKQEGANVVLNFLDMNLPERLQRRLDVTDFATPVKMIDTLPNGNGVKMIITPTGEYEHLAYQAEDKFVVEFKAITKEEKEEQKKKRFTYTGERLSLNFQDIEVRAVLQLLADFTDLNMVTSDSVGGNLTLRLTNVPWDQALDIILKAKGLAMRQTGNVILVAPTEEIAAREKLELESQNQIEELAPLRSEFIQINYAKAADLADLIKSQDNSLLSDRGNITVDERTNTLLVQDIDARLEDIHRLVDKLDIEVRQVLIEARVVNADLDFKEQIGVAFGSAGNGELEGGRGFVAGGALPGRLNASGFAGAAPGVPFITQEDGDVEGAENLLVDLAVAAPTSGVQFVLGKIGSHILELELTAAASENKIETIGSPRVVTLDKHEATIASGVEIPFLEASASGAATIQLKKAELRLKVTPSITPDDRIIMDLDITNNAALNAAAANGTTAVISTQELRSAVLVDNGETIVLGGVYQRDTADNVNKTPFFGDLPYIGYLFRQTTDNDRKRELLIFITPRILKTSLGVK